MAIYNPGNIIAKVRGIDTRIVSILDINFQNIDITLHVFPGRLSQNDILIKYKHSSGRLRTPKHIHWAVDLLIKRFIQPSLTKTFLKWLLRRWQSINPLNLRNKENIERALILSNNPRFINRFQRLNDCGFYNIEFLVHLLELLMLQEKTNRHDAYMFKKILIGILSNNDLYVMLSLVTHQRRN